MIAFERTHERRASVPLPWQSSLTAPVSVRRVQHRIVVGALASALLAGAIYAGNRGATNVESPSVAPPPPALAPAARLELNELLTRGAKLAPSDKATSLAGQRVVLEGYMAQMELAPKGAFYLTSRPVHCDEAGAGTADLPPDSVLVTSDILGDESVPFVSGPLEISGVLEVGNRTDAQGRNAGFRLTLDAPLAERIARLEHTEPRHQH